jgi:hypothetical protein
MMIVRDKQIEVFERRMFDAAQERIELAIAETFPELSGKTTRGGAELVREAALKLSAIVARGIESAVRFDISDGPDIAAFIALGLALRLAPPGESGRWIQDYLNRLETSGPTRLRMIESQLKALAADDKALGVIEKRVAQARERAVP